MVCAGFIEASENPQHSKRPSPKHRGQIYYYYSFSRKTNILIYGYRFCQTSITGTGHVRDLAVFLDVKNQFHEHSLHNLFFPIPQPQLELRLNIPRLFGTKIIFLNNTYSKKKRQSYSCNRQWRPTGLWEAKDTTFSRRVGPRKTMKISVDLNTSRMHVMSVTA
jgi:hypothetical protein